MKQVYTRSEVKEILQEVFDKIDNSCALFAAHHAIFGSYTKESKQKTLNAFLKTPGYTRGKGVKVDVLKEVLGHLGHDMREIPKNDHGTKGEHGYYQSTAKAVAAKYPWGSYIARSNIWDNSTSPPRYLGEHAFNIRHGRVHDETGIAGRHTQVAGLYKVEKRRK